MSKRKSIKEQGLWLQFRDRWMETQSIPLTCYYCQLQLVNDAPAAPRTLKCHVFRRKKAKKEMIATVDHVVPVSRGGGQFDKDNFVVSCSACNSKKADLPVEEFQKKAV